MRSLHDCVVQITLVFIVLYGVQALVLLCLILDNLETYNG